MKKGFWRSGWVVPIAVLIVGIAVLSVLNSTFAERKWVRSIESIGRMGFTIPLLNK